MNGPVTTLKASAVLKEGRGVSGVRQAVERFLEDPSRKEQVETFLSKGRYSIVIFISDADLTGMSVDDYLNSMDVVPFLREPTRLPDETDLRVFANEVDLSGVESFILGFTIGGLYRDGTNKNPNLGDIRYLNQDKWIKPPMLESMDDETFWGHVEDIKRKAG